MVRFVVANRRAGLYTSERKRASRDSVAATLGSLATANIVQDNAPEDPLARRVVVIDADPSEIRYMQATFDPDTIIEPEILHHPLVISPPDFIGAVPVGAPATSGLPFSTNITGGGSPLAGCKVTIYFRGFGGASHVEAITDSYGVCRVSLPAGARVAAILAMPAGDFWPTIARGIATTTTIECAPLPADGPLAWWHNAVGIGLFDPTLGAGVKVGVIDTGSGPHRCLPHLRGIGSFIAGTINQAPAQTTDVDGHGTHVAGTIGGQPFDAGDYAGIAPAAELFAARVFAPGQLASNADIANAIDELSRTHQVDLINMSLGASQPSEIVHDAIIDAYQRGTLCIAAAGNNAGAVNYPAAFTECVAVSALGLAGWGPLSSLSATRLPQEPDRFGRDNLFLANFSCFGTEIGCAAPGVGIIAPVYDPGSASTSLFAAMDGTSMASPIACGVAAALLSRHSGIGTYPRDASRSALTRNLLIAALQDVGLVTKYQGRGITFII